LPPSIGISWGRAWESSPVLGSPKFGTVFASYVSRIGGRFRNACSAARTIGSFQTSRRRQAVSYLRWKEGDADRVYGVIEAGEVVGGPPTSMGRARSIKTPV
jgi:hypothetical protein